MILQIGTTQFAVKRPAGSEIKPQTDRISNALGGPERRLQTIYRPCCIKLPARLDVLRAASGLKPSLSLV